MPEEQLIARVYRELRNIAQRQMRGQPPGHTLQASDLVGEAYLRLMKAAGSEGIAGAFASEDHFLSCVSLAMRSVLVDHARGKRKLKRIPPGDREDVDGVCAAFEARAIDLVVLDELLTRLEKIDPAMAKAVTIRFFGGQTLERTAEVVGIAPRSFDRRWKATQLWIKSQIA